MIGEPAAPMDIVILGLSITSSWGNGHVHISRDTFMGYLGDASRAAADLTSKAQILDALQQHGDESASWLASLDEATLAETVSFPPPLQPSQKSRLEMLLGVKEHEMHHRAQLFLIERLLGIVPHLTRNRQAATR